MRHPRSSRSLRRDAARWPLARPRPRQAQAARRSSLRILAINDFHGNLRPPPGGIRIADPDDKTKKIVVPAGGAEHMATLVRQLREGTKNTIFVAAGDLIGASPFLSAMFHDEPTIESLSMMGLEVASVGNHEFDEGKDELLADAERRLPSGRQMPGAAPVPRREISLSRRQHGREEHRQDRVSALRDQAIRGHSGRLHRPDLEGHAEHRLAGRASPGSNSATRPRR